MDVKIYIHGRPQGGDVWSKDVLDGIDASSYISPFLDYDIGRDVDALMIADRWRGCSYYTYFRHKGLMENNPSRGANAYFAITVKVVGAYCQKVSMLYNLLDQVYETKVLGRGRIIEPYDGSGLQRFVASTFKEKETDLAEIVSIIKVNMERVVAPYISALSQQTDTRNSVSVQYSLEDVDSPKFDKDSEQHRVILSAQYPSLKQRVALLNKEKGNISQQLTQISQKLNECEKELQTLRAEKNNAKKDARSREEREAARKADADYQDFCQIRKDFQEYQREKEGYKGYKSQKESFTVFQQHKDTLFDFSRRMAGTFSSVDKGHPKGGEANGKEGNKKSTSRIWLVWRIGVTVAIVLYVVINIVVLCKVCENGAIAHKVQTVVDSLKATTDSVDTNIIGENTSSDNVETSKTFTIDIDGYLEKKNNLYLQQAFELTAPGYKGNVRWSVYPTDKAKIVNGKVLVPIAVGKITIHGEADGAIITDREVTAVSKPQQPIAVQQQDTTKHKK